MENETQGAKELKGLAKLYIPFQIALIVLWGICLIPLIGLVYLGWFLFVPAIGFAVCNLLASIDIKDAAGVKNWDIVILVMSVVSIVPVLGWFSAAVGLAFSITSLIRFRKWASRGQA